MIKTLKYLAVAGFAVATALASGTPAKAAVSFEGKTFKIIIGYAAGGGYDLYARTMARHINKYLPGKPKVISQNMTGAGSIRAANYLYNVAPKDGTVFGTFARNLPLLAFSGSTKTTRFDPLKFTWIGTASSYKNDAYLMMVRKDTGITSIADLRTKGKPLNFASTAFGSTGHDVPLILRETLGINVQVIHGYPGGSTLYLAVERGEMDGRMVGLSSIRSRKPEWLAKDSYMIPLLQFARPKAHADFPDIPTARELASSEADLDLIKMMETAYFIARPFAGPPGIPAETAKVIRAAFMKVHSDPGYLKEAKGYRIDVSPLDGVEVSKIVARIGKLPRKLYDRYAKILANPKSAPRKVNWQTVTGTISKVKKKGKLEFKISGSNKKYKTRMRSRYTKVKINGKKASRKKIKAGMVCKIKWEGNGTYAGEMDCKK